MTYQAGEEKKGIPMWALVAAGVALIAFLVWWGVKNFGPQNPPLTAENVAVDRMLDEMAKKSGGDFSKLTPEEQEKVRKATGPYAGMVIANTARAKGYAK